MMHQIQLLELRLKEIGFDILVHENVLQIVGVSQRDAAIDETDFTAIPKTKNNLRKKLQHQGDEAQDLSNIDLDAVSHVLQVVIELEDPLSTGNKFIFQGCSLKVYFEGWELQELAKIIKFNIAAILEENGIFVGMNFEFPKSHEEVLVP